MSELLDPLIPSSLLDRLDEPLMPDVFPRVELPWLDELLERFDEEALWLELEPPCEPLYPSMSLSSDEALPLPFDEALKPPLPERSCELPSPEFVLPEAPRPPLRLFESPELLVPADADLLLELFWSSLDWSPCVLLASCSLRLVF